MYGYQGYGYQPNYVQPNYVQRNYAPQPPQMPQNQSQAFPPMQNTPIPENPIQDIKFVNRAQAEAYIVFPNTKVMLIDIENNVVYIKTADNMGQTQTTYFKFEQTNADGTPLKAEAPVSKVNLDNFVTIEEFTELKEKFNQMQKRLEAKANVGQQAKQIEPRVQVQ